MQYKTGEALLLETGRMSLAAGLFCVVCAERIFLVIYAERWNHCCMEIKDTPEVAVTKISVYKAKMSEFGAK